MFTSHSGRFSSVPHSGGLPSTSHSSRSPSDSDSDGLSSISNPDGLPSTPPQDPAHLLAQSHSLQSTRPNKGSGSHKELLHGVTCVWKSLRVCRPSADSIRPETTPSEVGSLLTWGIPSVVTRWTWSGFFWPSAVLATRRTPSTMRKPWTDVLNVVGARYSRWQTPWR